MEGAQLEQGSGSSSSSDDSQIVLALKRMVKKEIEVMVKKEIEVMVISSTVQQSIRLVVEDLIRNVVKEEIQSALAEFSARGNRNHEQDNSVPRERYLQLKFLDEVSPAVLTGQPIEGKGGTPIRVALVDKTTGRVVECGPESKAKVEILVLESSDCDAESNWSPEVFNSRIIRECDAEKPHFPKSNYVCLKGGIGVLDICKLGQGSNWTKSCKCRLGARIVKIHDGIRVEAAQTESFTVLDSRSQLYGKHYPPSLSDFLWRLDGIGKYGRPCKRLNDNNIFTVKDFLFLHSVDSQRLQKIAAGPQWKPELASCAKWNATVAHAQTCKMNDNKIYLYSSSEFEMGVTFNAVGGLNGIIRDSQYFPINNLSEAEKATAHKFLLSAFENQKDVTFYEDETSLLHQFPYGSNNGNAATNSNPEAPDMPNLTLSESIIRGVPMESGTPAQNINKSMCHVGSLESITLNRSHSESWSFPDIDTFFGSYDNNESFMALLLRDSNTDLSETSNAESHFHEQSEAGAVPFVEATNVILWVIQARKRCMAPRNFHLQKKRKINE